MNGPEADASLLPARMLNEYAYCPRLAYLEWVQGEFAHSADTLDGAWKHRRVADPIGALPSTEAQEASTDDDHADSQRSVSSDRIHARSVYLSALEEGLTAVIDLIEGTADATGGPASVTPVDYKRGAVPEIPERAWEADRVQLCAQGLILRARGYRCDSGIVYYAASRTRVPVPFDDALVTRTRQLATESQRVLQTEAIPPPLEDSPKCPRCSLVGICLPDEVNLLHDTPVGPPAIPRDISTESTPTVPVRRLVPALDESRPLYVQEQGAFVSKNGDCLEVRGLPEPKTKNRPILGRVRLCELSQLAVFGRAQVTTEALHALLDREIPVAYYTTGGWFRGLTLGLPGKNVDLRRRQYAAATDSLFCLSLARRFVVAKIENQRTLLRRNGDPSGATLDEMKVLAGKAANAACIETLLGLEGSAARLYFRSFSTMLRPRADDDASATGSLDFLFEKRNRRPPEDPVNALLSFGYALLSRDFTVACWAAGLDPFLGFFHQPRFGRPALALDLMEEFRPVIADSSVLTAINTGVVQTSHFVRRGNAVALHAEGRRGFIKAYERRLETLVTHPVFGYQMGYRRVLEVQARLLGRVLSGEIAEYPSFLVR